MSSKPQLIIIRELCEQLLKNGIHYCHWKSNASLNRSATGENDLDLLVRKADVDGFIDILSRLGFKQVVKRSKYRIPGIVDYYGYDSSTGQLVHVHAHYQLIVGHDATKNYHIPVEEAYIGSSTQLGMFMVPSPEFELILLVIRLMIKHATWDTLLLRQTNLTGSERKELDYLQEISSEAKITMILEEHFRYIPCSLFFDCLRSLNLEFPVLKRCKLGQRLLSKLAPFARQPQLADSLIKIFKRIYWPIEKRIFRVDNRKRMNNGGLVTAIVGGDGAGKTTAVKEVSAWLSGEFQVHQFHMGKPKWSYETIIIRGILKVGRALGFYPFERGEYKYTNDKNSIVFPGYPSLIRGVCMAHDRLRTYQNARRSATNGAIVILDRFPLTQVKFMDGPHLARVTVNLTSNRFLKRLINMEEGYYRNMALPDLLIILRVNPETAVQRKTTEKEESVRARSTEIWELNWEEINAHVIDANRPKEEVLKDVKQLIWSHL